MGRVSQTAEDVAWYETLRINETETGSLLLTRGRCEAVSDMSAAVVLPAGTRARCIPAVPLCSLRGLPDDVAYRISADIRLAPQTIEHN